MELDSYEARAAARAARRKQAQEEPKKRDSILTMSYLPKAPATDSPKQKLEPGIVAGATVAGARDAVSRSVDPTFMLPAPEGTALVPSSNPPKIERPAVEKPTIENSETGRNILASAVATATATDDRKKVGETAKSRWYFSEPITQS